MTNEELVQAYQNGDEKAFERLIAQNKGIVVFMKNRWNGLIKTKIFTDDELENEILYFLWKAAKKYNQTTEIKFGLYALKKIDWNLNTIWQRKKPNTENNITELDAIIPGTNGLTYGETIIDENALDPIELLADESEKKFYQQEVPILLESVLEFKECEIVKRFYGIGCQRKSKTMIGKEFGYASGSHISRIIDDAMCKLKNSIQAEDLFQKYCFIKGQARKSRRLETIFLKQNFLGVTKDQLESCFWDAVSFFDLRCCYD